MLAQATTSPAAQIVLAVLVGLVVGLIGWFVLGSAARIKKDREVEARMRAVMQPGGQQTTGAVAAEPGTG